MTAGAAAQSFLARVSLDTLVMGTLGTTSWSAPDAASKMSDDKARTAHFPRPRFVPLGGYRRYPEAEIFVCAEAFRDEVQRRRPTRHFSSEPSP